MRVELVERDASVTLFEEDGAARWTVSVVEHDVVAQCFSEAVVWAAGGLVCVGGGTRVCFLDAASGAVRRVLALDELHASAWALFGHFGAATMPDGTELMMVLTYVDAIAVDRSLAIRWTARDVAIDGVTFGGTREDAVVVHAEMDPPGGWFEVVLDGETGAERSRIPMLSPGYVGIYGEG